MPADFECELEVYCHRVTADSVKLAGVAKDKRKFKELPVSLTANIGKRLSSIVSGPAAVDADILEVDA